MKTSRLMSFSRAETAPRITIVGFLSMTLAQRRRRDTERGVSLIYAINNWKKLSACTGTNDRRMC